jgi:DNA-binding response OmpR family regulator
MALGSILVILPDARMQSKYWREFSTEGYSVVLCSSTEDAVNHLLRKTYDIIVFDIDEAPPGTALTQISHLRPRHSAPLIVQGSSESLGQLLAEFSQSSADKPAVLDADALVFKSPDMTELRITIQDLLSRRVKFSNGENSAAG